MDVGKQRATQAEDRQAQNHKGLREARNQRGLTVHEDKEPYQVVALCRQRTGNSNSSKLYTKSYQCSSHHTHTHTLRQ